jgi:AraC-like DNA-binding protein
MPGKKQLVHIDLTKPRYLKTLVENRRIFNLNNCELNVFESYEQAFRVPLTFSDFVITSMMRGKKLMHLFNKPAFEYLPGETVIVPAHETMVIDFPDASETTPTQCIALAVDARYIDNTLNYLNSFYNDQEENHEWKLLFNQYHFDNNNEVSELINKLIRVCSGNETTKNIYADLNLKELMIRLVQSQHLEQVKTSVTHHGNQTRLQYVIHFIHENLTNKILINELCRKAYLSRNHFFKWFREQFGITPLEYINRERIKLAKQLLAHKQKNVSHVSALCGFTDVNYFVRIFKKLEGITPGVYQGCMK